MEDGRKVRVFKSNGEMVGRLIPGLRKPVYGSLTRFYRKEWCPTDEEVRVQTSMQVPRIKKIAQLGVGRD